MFLSRANGFGHGGRLTVSGSFPGSFGELAWHLQSHGEQFLQLPGPSCPLTSQSSRRCCLEFNTTFVFTTCVAHGIYCLKPRGPESRTCNARVELSLGRRTLPHLDSGGPHLRTEAPTARTSFLIVRISIPESTCRIEIGSHSACIYLHLYLSATSNLYTVSQP